MKSAKPELKVSVFSDYICPFCYVGSRRLLRLNEEYDLKVNWRGLEIHPQAPVEGMPVTRLNYTAEQRTQAKATLREMAQEENIDIGALDFTTNSHKALLLSEAAKHAGRDIFYALHEKIFHAYFTEGKNISDETVLRTLAQEVGLSETLTDSAWCNPAYAQTLQLNLRAALTLSVRSAPTYFIGDDIIVGASSYTELQQAALKAVAHTA